MPLLRRDLRLGGSTGKSSFGTGVIDCGNLLEAMTCSPWTFRGLRWRKLAMGVPNKEMYCWPSGNLCLGSAIDSI